MLSTVNKNAWEGNALPALVPASFHESDEEEEELQQNQFAPQPQAQPLEGFDEEPAANDEMALMEVDGTLSPLCCVTLLILALE